jgi:hypothetical protein
MDPRDAAALEMLRADPVLARFELEHEIDRAFEAATHVVEDAPTMPVVVPLRIRVGTDLSWTLQ